MSLYSSHFLQNVSTLLQVEGEDCPDIQFKENAYLFLASEGGRNVLYENHQLQKSLGATIELFEPKALSGRYPWINMDGIKLASIGK